MGASKVLGSGIARNLGFFVQAVQNAFYKHSFGVGPAGRSDLLIGTKVLMNASYFIVIFVPVGNHLAVGAEWFVGFSA